MGIFNKLLRTVGDQFRGVSRGVKKRFSRGEAEEDQVDEVPASWVKDRIVMEKSRAGSKQRMRGELYLDKGKLIVKKNKVHVPWLKNIKRGLAGILLVINLVFSQFLMTQNGGWIVALMFMGNCFIAADYLWKTRRVDS